MHFITLFSGVKNADEAELRQVASEPVDLNVYNVNDFPLLSKLVARLVHILCGRIEDRGISKRNICLPIYLSVCQSVFSCQLTRHSMHQGFLMVDIFLKTQCADSLLLCLQEWSLGPQQTQPSPIPVLLISGFLIWAPERWSFTGLILRSQSSSTEWSITAPRGRAHRRSDTQMTSQTC